MAISLDIVVEVLTSAEAGALLLDPRPALLLDRRSLKPVFANAAGLAWAGLADVAALTGADLDLAEPIALRLDQFAADAPAGATATHLVRLASGDDTVLERIALARPNLGADLDCVLMVLSGRTERGGAALPELAPCSGPDRLVVLFDGDGEAAATLGDDALLDDIHDAVVELAAAPEDAPLRRKRLKAPDGERDVVLLPLAGGPEQVLLVERIARPAGLGRLRLPPRRRATTPEVAAPVASGATQAAPVAVVPAAEVAAPPATPSGDARPVVDNAVAVAAVADVTTTVEPVIVHLAAPQDATPADDAAMAGPVITDLDPEPPAPIEAAVAVVAAPIPAIDLPTVVAAREPDHAPEHAPAAVKFVWRMDAGRRFALVSGDLGDIVGPQSMPRAGESWADLAARLAFDEDGAIAARVAGIDTWSGRSVLWPVAGTARVVPVDLAALPIFGANHVFAGFQGFGTCRAAAVQDDPRAIGLSLAIEAAATQAEPASDTAAPTSAPALPVTAPAPADEPAQPGFPEAPRLAAVANDIVPARDAEALSGLSVPERTAFRQIAETLGEEAIIGAARIAQPAAAPAVAAIVEAAAAPAARPASPAEKAVIDRLSLACLVIGDDDMLHANAAFLTLFGYDDAADLRHAGGLDALFAGPHALREAMRGLERQPVPTLSRAGTVIPAHVRIATIGWGGSSAVLVTFEPVTVEAASGEDITRARKAAESAQAETERLRDRVGELETILDTATDGVLILDAGGQVSTSNRAAEALFGMDRDDLIGTAITDLLAPESRRAASDYLEGLSETGVASLLNDGCEVIAQVKPDGLIPLFMTVGRVGTGERAKFCVVLHDITQWKKSEEELTVARRRAEEASLHKSEFLAKISHEIRTPLNAIIGFSEVMLDQRFGAIGNDRYKDYLKDIHTSGAHIMSLVNDLLDLSKVEAGKMDLKFEAVPLGDVVGECVAIMQPQANRERIIIRTSLPSSVPPVVADKRAMRQIVLNLLSNAVKFTPAGGQVIVSSALEDNGEVVVRVRDTGYGMTAKEIETALEPFRQLHTTRSSGTGTGLGLPLTKALVEANRASFQIDSDPGQGTLVTIAFPVNRVLAG